MEQVFTRMQAEEVYRRTGMLHLRNTVLGTPRGFGSDGRRGCGNGPLRRVETRSIVARVERLLDRKVRSR
jgi:hypothetical protein